MELCGAVIHMNCSVMGFHPNFDHLQIGGSRFHPCCSKKSSFQDFEDYAKPRRLLPTQKLKTQPQPQPPDKLTLDASNSLYKLLLSTSSFTGSDLSNQNAAILVCIIDQHGDSILESLPLYEDDVTSPVIRFQRGSIDDFIFLGPKLATIQAMWISLDSGSWRLGGASLTIISACNHQNKESSPNGSMYCSTTYKFEVEDVLLGGRSDLSMVELRPCQIIEDLGADSISIIDGNSAQSVSLAEKGITKEESLREYANLKYSLLLYDSMLIFTGTSIASITEDKNTALAFLTGGIGGFLYLFLLQRSVDSLPSPEMNTETKGNNFDRFFRGVKGPIVVFTFAFLFAVLATDYDNPDVITALTPKEILAGMVGFLACKVSVVLAAFRPLSMGLKDND